MLEQILKSSAKATTLLAAGITKELLGEPKVDAQKFKVKAKLQEIEKLLNEKKEKISKDFYFSSKTKLSSFHSAITRYRDLDKLKKLEDEAKKLIEEIKARSK